MSQRRPVRRRPRPARSRAPRARPRRRAQGRRAHAAASSGSRAFAVLLAGVVALNVAVLRVNMSVEQPEQAAARAPGAEPDARVAGLERRLVAPASSAPRAGSGSSPRPRPTRATSISAEVGARDAGRQLADPPAPALHPARRSARCSRARPGSRRCARRRSRRSAQVQTKATVVLPAGRGTIFDSMGAPLALGEQATTVYVDPHEVRNPRARGAASPRASSG